MVVTFWGGGVTLGVRGVEEKPAGGGLCVGVSF
jgi:hypothetical protein